MARTVEASCASALFLVGAMTLIIFRKVRNPSLRGRSRLYDLAHRPQNFAFATFLSGGQLASEIGPGEAGLAGFPHNANYFPS